MARLDAKWVKFGGASQTWDHFWQGTATAAIAGLIAVGSATLGFAGLFDSSRNQLAVTSNDTTTAWAANTVKTLLVTTPYTVTTSGLYYVGIMVAATTVPTLKGPAALTATQVHGAAPIINGNSSSGLTTSLPNPAAAITVSTTQVWGAVS